MTFCSCSRISAGISLNQNQSSTILIDSAAGLRLPFNGRWRGTQISFPLPFRVLLISLLDHLIIQQRLIWPSQISAVKVAFMLNRYLPFALAVLELKCTGLFLHSSKSSCYEIFWRSLSPVAFTTPDGPVSPQGPRSLYILKLNILVVDVSHRSHYFDNSQWVLCDSSTCSSTFSYTCVWTVLNVIIHSIGEGVLYSRINPFPQT